LGEFYNAPLLLGDVGRWGQESLALRNYRIERLRGVPAEKTMLDNPKTLAQILNDFDCFKAVHASTPVVDLVCLLPIASKNEFSMQFNPYFTFGSAFHRDYRFTAILENSLSGYAQLNRGMNTEVKDIDENQRMFNWRADALENLSEIELMLASPPSCRGHMILIATPVEPEKPLIDFGKLLDFGDALKSPGSLCFGKECFGLKSTSLGARIGEASLGRGSESGKGTLVTEEVLASRKGNPIIYHIKFLTVTPEQAASFDSSAIAGMGSALNNFSTN